MSVDKVTEGINEFTRTVEHTQYEDKINQNEKEIFDIDMKIGHPDNHGPDLLYMITILKKRKKYLEDKNNYLKAKL